MMDWIDQCLGFQGGGMMMLAMIIFWGLLFLLGFYFLKALQNGKTTKNEKYFDILKERLVSGQITEEEYNRLKNKLI